MAILAVLDKEWEKVFGWLGLALFIDGIDGTFARVARVKTVLPRFSGEQLDLVIDYVTYVLVPVLALRQAGFLPGAGGLVIGSLILLSSLYHFSDTESKTEDHCFVGFPAIWNIVAFYLFAFAAPQWVTIALVLACVGLTFVPMRWVHPLRVATLWPVTGAMMVAWSIAAFVVVRAGFSDSGWPRLALAVVAVYGIGLSLVWPWAESKRRKEA